MKCLWVWNKLRMTEYKSDKGNGLRKTFSVKMQSSGEMQFCNQPTQDKHIDKIKPVRGRNMHVNNVIHTG